MLKQRVIGLSLVVCVLYGAIAYAAADSNRQHLQQLNRSIRGVRYHLARDQTMRTHLQRLLAKYEKDLGRNHREIRQLRHRLARLLRKKNWIAKQRQHWLQQLHSQVRDFNQLIRMAYVFSRERGLKVLLNQNEPRKLARMLAYFDVINTQRLGQLTHIRQVLSGLVVQTVQLKRVMTNLQTLASAYHSEQKTLRHDRRMRAKLLSRLNRSMATSRAKLGELTLARRALERVVATLPSNPQLASIFGKHAMLPLFSHMRGQLRWPTRGHVIRAFHSRQSTDEMPLEGLVIGAHEGQAVYAIYPGKVVFADWLRGFGLLTIIDHGNGYLSLYGRNESLYHSKGDQVKRGDLIARVGNSGGFRRAGLYFALRHRRIPMDPAHWCRQPS